MWGGRKGDDRFYKAFVTLADQAVGASELLLKMVQEPSRIPELAMRINAMEHDGDQVVKDTRHALRAQWITPFDRTDINTLISHEDDVLDVIHAISQRFGLFEITEMRAEASEFAVLIQQACVLIREAVGQLHDRSRSEQILQLVERIDATESAGDELYRRSLARLFREGGDPLYVMKWREMFEKFEEILDLASDVGDELEGVVLEYA